ncbi:hypothetical protein LCGC14_0381520 [marine sediment metagenome]|uniref:Uncharacterized protein n=1 Tax=marine sediment metagenome TaxID=412755 RepID=A0A0F9T1X0_9ZZZZ
MLLIIPESYLSGAMGKIHAVSKGQSRALCGQLKRSHWKLVEDSATCLDCIKTYSR